MSWYTESHSWICAQKIKHPEFNHSEMRKHCSKNYPFSERSGYAYKAFLKAMRDHFGAAKKPVKTNQGELSLIKE